MPWLERSFWRSGFNGITVSLGLLIRKAFGWRVFRTRSPMEVTLGKSELGHDFADDFAGDVGETERSTMVLKGQAFVIETEEVEHGGV